MSRTWLRCDVDGEAGWERSLAELQEAGVPLPRGLAVLDLRWWQDRILAPGSRVRLPGLRELAERWGWRSPTGAPSVKRVRLLLQDEATWSDPRRLDEWRRSRAVAPIVEGHDEGTGGAREGHGRGTTDSGTTPTTGQRGHDEGTTRAREGHDEGHTRWSRSPSPSPSRSVRGSAPARSAPPSPEPTPLEVLAATGEGLQGAAARLCVRLVAGVVRKPDEWLDRDGPRLVAAQLATVGEIVRRCELARVTPEELDQVVWDGRWWPRPLQVVGVVQQERARRRELEGAAQLELPEALHVEPSDGATEEVEPLWVPGQGWFRGVLAALEREARGLGARDQVVPGVGRDQGELSCAV